MICCFFQSGYEALKKIEDCITKKKSRDDLMEACSEFYTKIPHDFGMKVPPAITTESELKEKISLLETLGDIQVQSLYQIINFVNYIKLSYMAHDLNYTRIQFILK